MPASSKCMGVRLAGDLINDENERGEPIVGETLLILLNAHWEPISFTLPATSEGHIWDRILDTADLSEQIQLFRGPAVPAPGPIVVVLVARSPQDAGQTATPRRPRSWTRPMGQRSRRDHAD